MKNNIFKNIFQELLVIFSINYKRKVNMKILSRLYFSVNLIQLVTMCILL